MKFTETIYTVDLDKVVELAEQRGELFSIRFNYQDGSGSKSQYKLLYLDAVNTAESVLKDKSYQYAMIEIIRESLHIPLTKISKK